VASLSLAPGDRWRIVFLLLAGVLLSILLGLGQKFQGPQSWLYFYEDASRGSATGTFANRNFFAALLYCAIPLTWALSLRLIRDGRISRYVVALFGGIMLLVIILGLASAGSRAGIILAMVALLASATLGWGGQATDRRSSQSRWAIIAAAVALLVLGQFGMVAILRLAELDPVSDYRTQISEVSLRAAWAYFPFGSGFGTFVPVYAMYETPKTMLASYVNHAHNDWLELWLEGGLPAALLLIGFLAWYAMGLFRLWRPSSQADHLLLQRAAAITCGLLLLHSIVDYPLREPMLAALFGLFCGFMTFTPDSRRRPKARRTSEKSDTGTFAPFDVPRTKPIFVRGNGPPL
jgi:O-antigen ligase